MRKTPIKKRYAASLFLMILAPVVLFPSHACAYIDPNTGGYVFQILFPVLSAIAGMFLFFRNTIKQLFGWFMHNSTEPGERALTLPLFWMHLRKSEAGE